jgi:hypothetical protein
MYADFCNVPRNIFSLIPHGAGVQACVSHRREVIGWRQSKTRGETLHEKVVVRQYARAKNRILAGNDPVLDMIEAEIDIELKREADERKLHRMAKVNDFLEMWQGSQNPRATLSESCAHTMQITAVGYISATEDIVNTSWTNFQHDGVAAFKLSESLSQPTALSAKDLLRGRTQIFNVC